MLAKVNRINAPGDFRHTMRKGKKKNSSALSISVLSTKNGEPTRFGFVVSKAVGNAVTRNTVKRRLRAIAAEVIATTPNGLDVVVRPLELAGDVSFDELKADVFRAVSGFKRN